MPPIIHSILGASAAERWMNCPPSARLTAGMQDEETIFAAEGTAAHALCEWKVRKALKMRAGRRPASDYWTDEMEEHTDDYRDYVMDLVGKARQTCKDPVTMIEQHLDFSCWVPDGYGTGDFLLVADGELNIVDFKYGRGVPVYADHNPQMMLYGLGALDLFDMLYDIETVTMTIFQPRLSNISVWSLTAKELYQWAAEELKPKAEMASKGEGEYTPGSWCRFCKARNQCRARTESFLELARMEFCPPALLSDEEIAEVMGKADELSRWASDVMAYATAAAIEDGRHFEGYKIVEGRSTRKFTDAASVEQAAKKAGYTDIYNKSLITLTAFEKLMGKETFKEILGACVSMKAADYLMMPDLIVSNVEVQMDDKEQAKYDQLKSNLVLPMDGGDIDAASAVGLTNKLLQMSNGAVYDENGKVRRIHERKLDALEDLIEAANGKPILITYWFKHDRERILERFDAVPIDKPEDIEKWNRGEIPVAIIHPASAGHGLNLQAGGCHLVWFGLTWSLELYQQCCARLYRQGQKHTVTIQHIITKGTMDERVLAALEKKDDTQESIMEAVKAELGGGRGCVNM